MGIISESIEAGTVMTVIINWYLMLCQMNASKYLPHLRAGNIAVIYTKSHPNDCVVMVLIYPPRRANM